MARICRTFLILYRAEDDGPQQINFTLVSDFFSSTNKLHPLPEFFKVIDHLQIFTFWIHNIQRVAAISKLRDHGRYAS